jgi:hypothetical protein
MGFFAIAIGIWRIFFIEKPDQFVQTVNENFNLWILGCNVIVMLVYIALRIRDK